MSESNYELTPGSGLKIHTDSKSIGGNTLHDQYVMHGEPFLATYTICASMTAATAASHLLQIMAGTTLIVYVRRIVITQYLVATTAALSRIQLLRLSTAGTGGGAVTPTPLDTTDSASGATAMTLATAKGTEGAEIGRRGVQYIQTVPTGLAAGTTLAEWDFERMRTKGIRIPAGTANGIAIKNLDAAAATGLNIEVLISEANF